MGIFSKVSGKEVDEFAKNIAMQVVKKYPPEMESGNQKKLSEKRITRILEDVFKRASDFKHENKLGFYKKARLGNAFKWELDTAGYSKDFITVATEGMVVYITRNKEKIPK